MLSAPLIDSNILGNSHMGPHGSCRIVHFTSIWLLIFLLFPASVQSAPGAGDEISDFFRVIWGLLVVIGVILIIYGLMRKKFSLLTTTPEKEIKVLEIKPLMGKKALCLVEVRGKEFLLGLSGDNISHLASLDGRSEPSFDTVMSEVTQGGDGK